MALLVVGGPLLSSLRQHGRSDRDRGFLNMLLRNADIVPVSDMTGIIEFGGIWKKRGRVFGVPAYWVFRLYSQADVTRLVETQNNGQKYDVVQGSTRLPTICGCALSRRGSGVEQFGEQIDAVLREPSSDERNRNPDRHCRFPSHECHSTFNFCWKHL